MNSLQIELNEINDKLDLLLYRKNQLEEIITEYSDVVNRVKNLIDSMQDANVEPSNLLAEIEQLIYCPEQEQEPDTNHEKINSYIIPFDPLLHGEPDTEPTSEEPEAEATEPAPEETLKPTQTPEQRGNSLLFHPQTYWDNESSVRMFIPKKRRYKTELEALANDCIGQGLAEKYEIAECGTDWIIQLAPVTDELTVNGIIDNFYPKHTDGEPEETLDTTPQPTPEPVRLMVAVSAVVTPTPETEEAPPKWTYLNERAWRRNDSLLIGFTNKQLMSQWHKWIKEAWGDGVAARQGHRTHIDDTETLDSFKYCLSVLWHGSADWERLSKLDYSLKPTEQTPIKTDPFTYQSANGTTWQIFRDGVLLGLAKDCGSGWESPQFNGQRFDSKEAVAIKLWELINQF